MVKVLYEDNHLLVLNKPAGMLTQPNQTEDFSLEKWGKLWLKRRFQKPGEVFLHSIHRLDRPVSGIVVFARTSKALSRLNEAQRQKHFCKHYIALVEGRMPSERGILEHYLEHAPFCARLVPATHIHAKRCSLEYKVEREVNGYTQLRISLITGRYHQIRAQLAAIQKPIVGDIEYGSPLHFARLCLHHTFLSFPHPVKNEIIEIESPMSGDWCG